jgi:hypothetical protein
MRCYGETYYYTEQNGNYWANDKNDAKTYWTLSAAKDKVMELEGRVLNRSGTKKHFIETCKEVAHINHPYAWDVVSDCEEGL